MVRWGDLYRGRASVEREFGWVKHQYGLAPIRVRGLAHAQLHADLTMLARLSQLPPESEPFGSRHSIRGVTPQGMRRLAVVVVLVGAFTAGLGTANLASGFVGGQIWTVVAFVGVACAVGLAVELWYVSRRIERARFANRTPNHS